MMVSGKGARTKGHSFERKIANDLRILDATAKRNLEYQEGSGYDIETWLPYLIQCKSQKRVNWLQAMREIPEIKEQIPIVAGKVTGIGEFAFLKWSDFLMMIKRIHIQV